MTDKPAIIDPCVLNCPQQSTDPDTFKKTHNQSDPGSLQPCISDTDSFRVCAFSEVDFLLHGGSCSAQNFIYFSRAEGETGAEDRAVLECEGCEEGSQAVLGQVSSLHCGHSYGIMLKATTYCNKQF